MAYQKSWTDQPEADIRVVFALWLAQWKTDAAVSEPGRYGEGPVTVQEFAQRVADDAKTRYVGPAGPTSHAARVRDTFERLCNHDLGHGRLLAHTPADALDAPTLARFRDAATHRQDGTARARSSVNDMLYVIREGYRLGVEWGVIAPDTAAALARVRNLQRGRSDARERRKVESVPRADFDAVLPACTRPAAALLELMWMTGMRSTEACVIRATRIEMRGELWLYAPERYKGQHRDDHQSRLIVLDAAAQDIINPWMIRNLGAYLFPPVGPRSKLPHYSANSLRLNVTRGCQKTGTPRWTPHQVRHARATNVYAQHGHDAASKALGHRGEAAPVTLCYVDQVTLDEGLKARALEHHRRMYPAS